MEKVILDQQRFSEKELSKYWGVKRKTLQKWRTMGIGPAYIKLGAKVVYPYEYVAAFERSRIFAGSGQRIEYKGGADDK